MQISAPYNGNCLHHIVASAKLMKKGEQNEHTTRIHENLLFCRTF